MTPDQTQRISALSSRLAETFIEQANPDNWTGAGISPSTMDKEARGSRNWDLRNANQIGALLMRSLELISKHASSGSGAGDVPATDGEAPPAPDPDDEIRRYEKQAKELLESVGAKRKA